MEIEERPVNNKAQAIKGKDLLTEVETAKKETIIVKDGILPPVLSSLIYACQESTSIVSSAHDSGLRIAKEDFEGLKSSVTNLLDILSLVQWQNNTQAGTSSQGKKSLVVEMKEGISDRPEVTIEPSLRFLPPPTTEPTRNYEKDSDTRRGIDNVMVKNPLTVKSPGPAPLPITANTDR